jgi:hypothetical protein
VCTWKYAGQNHYGIWSPKMWHHTPSRMSKMKTENIKFIKDEKNIELSCTTERTVVLCSYLTSWTFLLRTILCLHYNLAFSLLGVHPRGRSTCIY